MSKLTKPLREPFQAELYVERTELTQELLKWIDDPKPSFRLRSVVGAAGSGKSWFMANLFLRLHDRKDVVPLWLDLSEQPLHPDRGPGIYVRNQIGALKWLQDIIQQNAWPKDEIPLDSTASFAANFAHFTTRICGFRRNVVLLVDSFDEVSHEEMRSWEEDVFSPFFRAACTRLIIARRDDYALTHPILRWNDEVRELPGLGTPEQQQQVQARLHNEPSRQMPDLTPYLTANPYINTLLLKRLGNKSRLSSEDLDACVQDVMQRVNVHDRSSRKLLWELVVRLPQVWTARQLSKETGMLINDLEPLFESGVVSHIGGSPTYEVDASIYQLIQQSLQMQQNQR